MNSDSRESSAAAGDILGFLSQRRSQPLLSSPAPNKAELETIVESALHVPDHKRLSPWRVIAVEEGQRDKLAGLWNQFAVMENKDENKLKKKASRAPLILICIASIVDHPKVPDSEQVITAGIAAYTMLMAANGLGYQGYWRTGKLAYDRNVFSALGLTESESIVGYLYLGSGEANTRSRPEGKTLQDKLSYFI